MSRGWTVAQSLAPAVVAAVIFFAPACRRSGPEKPNLVLVTIDTLRADRLGCYGHPRSTSPQMDRLAAEGVRVDRAYAVAPITAPSHASLLTGLYPLGHGVHTNGLYKLGEGHTTLAELLAAQGYETAAFVGAVPLDHRFGFAQGFATFDDDFSKSALRGLDLSPWYRIPLADRERRADEVMEPAMSWLRTRSPGKPFFLWVHLFDPHSPYSPPPAWKGLFEDNQPPRLVDPELAALLEQNRSWHRWLKGMPSVNYIRRLYEGEIAYTDSQVGKLLASIDQLELRSSTVIALTADHGEDLGEHGEYFFHGDDVSESAVRVPLIFRVPWRVKAGTLARARARGVDLMPTLLELLDMPPLSEPHGESLVASFRKQQEELRPVLLEARYRDGSGRGVRGYIEGHLKLTQTDARDSAGTTTQCFDLSRDPLERVSLCNERTDEFAELKFRLDDWVQRLERGQSATFTVDREALEALESLGYQNQGSAP